MSGATLTREQREIMEHAIDKPYRLKMRGKMNENEFRNYFCVVVGGENFADIEQLVGIGLMSWGFFLNGRADRYAHVTDAGIREVMP